MRKYFPIILLFTLLGCDDFFDKDVYVELPEHQPRIVLNAVFNEGDTLVRMVVTKSVAIDSKESSSQRLQNVKITLLRNGIEVTDIYLDDRTGHYISEHEPQVGDVYKITVEVPGLETITSETTVPQKASLLSAKYAGLRYDINGYEQAAIKFKIKDIDRGSNRFEVILSNGNNTSVTRYGLDGTVDSTYTFGNTYDETYLSSPIGALQATEAGLQFSDASFKNNEIEFEIWTETYIIDQIEEFNRTQQYYREDGSLLEEAVFSKVIAVKVRAVTEAYQDYITTYEIHRYNQYPDLFTGEPVPMPSNIKNGYGLFGATSSTQMEITFD
jgi:hypothetical protein